MKYRIVVLITFLLASSFAIGQSKNTIIRDPKLNKNVLIGYCNRQGLKQGLFGKYFETQYTAYKPSDALLNKLRKKINKTQITIVFGSWCSDSEIQVPRFYKILDKVGYNEKNLTLIAVDRSMNALIVDVKDLNLKKIPLFIIYENGEELGRITESPKKTLEKDLLEILKKVK